MRPPLSEADGREEVYHPGSEVMGIGLQFYLDVGKDRGKVFEGGPGTGGLGVEPIHLLDSDQAEVPLSIFGRPYLPANRVSGPQSESPYLGLGDVHVTRGRPQPILSQEAVSL